MKKFLVIGASGQVGNSIYRMLVDRAHKTPPEIICDGTCHNFNLIESHLKLDISNYVEVKETINACNPDVVFLPAAITNVDLCEQDPEETYKINVLGVKNVVDVVSSKPDKQIIFFSTDFVFNGKEGYYDEDAVPGPINRYGYQKLLAEHYVMAHSDNYKIIRSNVIYGHELQGKNFVVRLLDNLRKGNEATIPMDEYGTPTYGPDLAEIAINLATSLVCHNGIYHISGTQLVNRYKFALEVAKIFDCDTKLVKPILSSDLKRPALRPLNAGLKSNKNFVQPSDYTKGLRKMKAIDENLKL